MSTSTSLVCNKFGGIRRVVSSFSDNQITCSDCQNVELFYTGVNGGIGVRSAKGNTSITSYFDNSNLSVYTVNDEELEEVSTDGSCSNILTFTLDDEVQTGFYRDEKEDRVEGLDTYYAWSKVIDGTKFIYYTEKDGTDVLSIIPSDETILGLYESIQGGIPYRFIYTESDTEGKIYKLDIQARTITLMVDDLTKTGKCTGLTLAQGWSDWFVFSNGEDILNIEIGRKDEDDEPDEVHIMELTDPDDRPVKGLGLILFDGRLWIFGKNVLWYSRQEQFTDFHTATPDQVTSAGYIEFVKEITAIYAYLGTVAVFHSDCSTLISIEDDGTYSKEDDSPGGCASYNSLVFHGTELYFFDFTKKGVFSFKQVVNGDKTLGENIAIDVQDILCDIELDDISRIRTMSVLTKDKNEIWVLIPDNSDKYSTILIFDYLNGEWLKRKCNRIEGFTTANNRIYSFGKNVYEEYVGNDFDGEFIEAYYNCSPMNLGMDNSLKIFYFPPRVTLDMTRTTEFCCKYIRNYDYLKKAKIKLIKTKSVKNAMYWNQDKWNEKSWTAEASNSIYKLSSSTFKVLEIQLIAREEGQEFAVKNIEFSKIKVKQV